MRQLVTAIVASYVLAWGVYFVVSRQVLVSKIVNCTLSTVAGLAMLGLLELPAALGLVDYRLVITPAGRVRFAGIKLWEDPRNRFDPELIYTRRPGEHIAGETVGDLTFRLGLDSHARYPIDAQYDSHGFRNDREIDRAPIVALGDSFIESGLVAREELLTTRLAQALRVEVANLGLSSYGPQQELATLRRYGLAMHPQLVAWFFYDGNDLTDVTHYDHFTRDRSAALSEYQSFRRRSFAKNALEGLRQALAALLSIGTRENRRADVRRRSCFLPTGTDGNQTLYLDYPGKPLSRRGLANLVRAEQYILEAHDLAERQGARMLLVFVPTKFRVYHAICAFPADGYGRGWVNNDLPGRLGTWTSSQKIPFVDLTGPLEDAAARGGLVYFPDDCHWNAAGQAVAARTLADFIREHGLLGSEAAPDGGAG